MKTDNVVTVMTELKQAIKKLKFHPIYQTLKIPSHKIMKKRKIRRIMKDTVVWIWGKCLMEQDRKNAEVVYYCAQIHPDFKRIRKHFSSRKWHARCLQCYETNPDGTPNYKILAQSMISKIGASHDTNNTQESDDVEKKLAEHLTNVHMHLKNIIKDADLSDADMMFRVTAAGRLGLGRIDGQ